MSQRPLPPLPPADASSLVYRLSRCVRFMQVKHHLTQPLPAPIAPGNSEAFGTACHLGRDLAELIVSNNGWAPEDIHEKFGFVSTQSGVELLLNVGAVVSSISVSFTRGPDAYFGDAEVTCEGGCACEPEVVSGHFPGNPVRTMRQFYLSVAAPAPACQLRFTAREMRSLPPCRALHLCTDTWLYGHMAGRTGLVTAQRAGREGRGVEWECRLRIALCLSRLLHPRTESREQGGPIQTPRDRRRGPDGAPTTAPPPATTRSTRAPRCAPPSLARSRRARSESRSACLISPLRSLPQVDLGHKNHPAEMGADLEHAQLELVRAVTA